MTLWNLTAAELLARTASAEPTPGGGSVSAIGGALGLGLVCMALEITTGRHDAAPEVTALLDRTRTGLEALKLHPDADVAAFGGYMAALALPRSDEAQKSARKQAMQAAALAATQAPLAAARDLLAALELARLAAPLAHRGVVSDVGAGAHLLGAALQATLLNVDINLGSLPAGEQERARNERRALAEAGASLSVQVTELVAGRLTK